MILETFFFILCIAIIVALIYTYGVPLARVIYCAITNRCRKCGNTLYDWRGADVCLNKDCENYGLYEPDLQSGYTPEQLEQFEIEKRRHELKMQDIEHLHDEDYCKYCHGECRRKDVSWDEDE